VQATFPDQGGGEGIRHYEATILGDERDGKNFGDGKIETIGEIAILGPFAIGSEIGDRAFDLDDRKLAAAAEGEDIGSPTAGERELEKAREAELFERAANAAGKKRSGQGLIAGGLTSKDGVTGHRAVNERGVGA